jgi:hypothetical protein
VLGAGCKSWSAAGWPLVRRWLAAGFGLELATSGTVCAGGAGSTGINALLVRQEKPISLFGAQLPGASPRYQETELHQAAGDAGVRPEARGQHQRGDSWILSLPDVLQEL